MKKNWTIINLGLALLLMAAYLISCRTMSKKQVEIEDLVVDTADLRLVSAQFNFTEGPAVDKEGNIFFTDQPDNKIWKYDTRGNISLFMENAGRSNGLYFDQKGNIIACADENNQLWSVSPEKDVKILMSDYKGFKLNGPNDLWIDARGGIYFTDPYYQRKYWSRKQAEIEKQSVYYLPPGSNQPLEVANDLVKPNGIVGTKDGTTLYVADIGAGKIYRYTIAGNASLTKPELFASEGADGITLDGLGNLYLAGNGINVYSPGGAKIGRVNIPEKWTANLCFGGKNRDLLFITASKAVYVLPMKVKGIE